MSKLGRVIDFDSKELLRKSGGALFVKVIGTGLSLVFYMMVSRQLGKERAGEFFLSITLTIIFAALARWGLDNAVTRNAASAQASGQVGALTFILKYSLRLVAFTSIFASVLLAIGARPLAVFAFHDPNLVFPLQLTAASIVPLALYTIQFQFLQGLGKIRAAMLLSSFWPQVFMVAAALVSIRRFGVAGAVSAYTTGCAAAVMIGYFYTKPTLNGIVTNDRHLLKELTSSCNSLFVASIAELLISWVPVVLVGFYAPLHDVAEFAVGQRLSNLLGFFFLAVNTTVSSRIASNYRLGKMDALGRTIRHSSIIMTIGALPVFLAFAVMPKLVLRMFGEGFATGASILVVLSLGQMVNVITGPVACALVMCGKERVFTRIQISSATLACALVLLGLRTDGAFGAAVGVAIAIAFKNILCSIFVWITLGIAPISFRTIANESPNVPSAIPHHPDRIVLVGYYGSNLGDLIMLKALLEVFRGKGAVVSIFTYGAISPSTREIARGAELVSLVGPSRAKSVWKFLSACSGAKGVAWGGGTCFMDEGGEGAVKYMLLAKLLGAKIYYLGIGVGNSKQLKTKIFVRLARLISEQIVVRDAVSASKMGGLSKTVRVAPDLAFAMSLPEFPAQIEVDQNVLLVAYRCLNEYLPLPAAEEVLQQFCDRLEELIRQETYTSIQIIDTDTDIDREDSDRIFNRMHLAGLPAVRCSEGSPLEKLKLIKSAAAVITGRLHVAVFAAEIGRPFLVVNYSPKIEAFVRTAGMGESLINYRELADRNLFIDRIRSLRQLQVALPGTQKKEVLQALEEMYATL